MALTPGPTEGNQMVAAEETKRVYWTDADFRRAVERFVEKRLWSTVRLASDMSVTTDLLNRWMDGEPASAQLRVKLQRLVQHWEIPHPRAESEEEATPEPAARIVSMNRESGPFDYVRGAADAPEPEPVVRATFPPPSGVVEVPATAPVTGEFVNLSPLPFGFAMLVPPELPGRGHPAAIVLRDNAVAISKPLQRELDGAGHLLIGIESRTDVAEADSGIAIAVVTEGSPFFDYAMRVPKNHEWAATVRKAIGALPNGVYLSERVPDTDTWVCRREENA